MSLGFTGDIDSGSTQPQQTPSPLQAEKEWANLRETFAGDVPLPPELCLPMHEEGLADGTAFDSGLHFRAKNMPDTDSWCFFWVL